MLNIGDAVLTFLGDTSQLDQVFARLPAQTEAAMGAAAGSAGVMGDALGGINFELDATASNVPYCGEVIKETMDESAKVTREARGEAGLLGEAFGIHLPRHVRSFLAELPGVGTALAAAFTATAVLFIIDAVVQLVEKIAEFAKSGEEIEKAWEAVDLSQREAFDHLEDNIIRAELKTAELTGNYLEALRLKLQQLDRSDLSDLAKELESIAKASDDAFLKMDRNWFGKMLGLEGSEDAKAKFDEIARAVNEALSAKTPEAFSNAMKLVDAGMADAQKKVEELEAAQKKFQAQMEATEAASAGHPVNVGLGPDPKTLESWEKLNKLLGDYKADIAAAQTAEEKEKSNIKLEDQIKGEERLKKAAEERFKVYQEVAKAHDVLDKQIQKGVDDTSKIESARLATQLKEEEAAHVQELKLLHDQEVAAIAAIDNEMKDSQQKYDQQAILLKAQYDRRLISAQQYLASLKSLGDREVVDLKQALDRKQQLVILEAQNEAAQRGKILTTEDAKELKSYTDLEAKKAQVQAEYNNKFLKVEDQVTAKLVKNQATLGKLLDDYSHKLRGAEKDLKGFANVAVTTLHDISGAFGSAIEQWIEGQKSFGAAFAEAVKSYLAGIAAKAAADAIYFTGMGIAELATGFSESSAAEWFAAAAEMGLIAGAAGGLAAAIPSGNKGNNSGSSGTTGSTSTASAASGSAAAAPSGGVNVKRLFSGGIVEQPTYALIGDRQGGGSQREAVLPLDDVRAMRMFAEAFGGGGGGSQNHYYLPGFRFSTSDTTKLAKQLSRQASTGRVRLSVSNSSRLTRKS